LEKVERGKERAASTALSVFWTLLYCTPDAVPRDIMHHASWATDL
jgi:hypothetical protein